MLLLRIFNVSYSWLVVDIFANKCIDLDRSSEREAKEDDWELFEGVKNKKKIIG
jgi:hypothetical protein